jgi:hypothetical protein
MSDFEQRYQKKHKSISLIKSVIRLASCGLVLLMPYTSNPVHLVAILALGFGIAEVLGIWEEMI